MAYITLEEAKEQINGLEDYSGDDSYITGLIGAAEDVVERDICRPLGSFEDENGDIPSGLRHAILLMVANFYSNREPVAFAKCSEVPLSYRHLTNLYRDFEG